MKKIILNLAVTLDGFIEGPKGEIDWLQSAGEATAEDAFESHFEKFLNGIDTILYGRVSYDMWGQYQPPSGAPEAAQKLWDGVHSKRKFVFSENLNTIEGDAVLINSDIPDRIREIKAGSGKDIWLYGGAGLITSFMNLQLIDTYLLAVYPVILGAGKPLFTGIKDRVNLRLRNITPQSGVVLMEYDSKRQ